LKEISFWGIPLTSHFDHLNGKTRSKNIGSPGVLFEEKKEAIVAWVLNM
jgi:hypothetical protein